MIKNEKTEEAMDAFVTIGDLIDMVTVAHSESCVVHNYDASMALIILLQAIHEKRRATTSTTSTTPAPSRIRFCQYCGQPLEGHNAAMCDGDKGDTQ